MYSKSELLNEKGTFTKARWMIQQVGTSLEEKECGRNEPRAVVTLREVPMLIAVIGLRD